MQEIDLVRIDLNLLVVFEAIMAERHIGRAGERLGLTQPAVSHALSRLRGLVDDPLFVRHARGVRPTPRALAFDEMVKAALKLVRAGFASGAMFDPTQTRRRLQISAADYISFTLMPPLVARLRSLAPHLELRIRPLVVDSLMADLRRRDLDLAIGLLSAAPAGLLQTPLFTEKAVMIAKRDRSSDLGALTPEQFAALPHLIVGDDGEAPDGIDQALRRLGLSRKVALVTPHFLAAPFIVGATDYVAVVAERIAQRFAKPAGLGIHPLPLPVVPWTLGIVQLEETREDSLLTWVVSQMRHVAHQV